MDLHTDHWNLIAAALSPFVVIGFAAFLREALDQALHWALIALTILVLVACAVLW